MSDYSQSSQAGDHQKVLLIDGHSAAFRAFYALKPEAFRTADGQHTNAVYGFLRMLVKTVSEEKPSRIAVAFDVSRESFRTRQYPEYKGGRKKTPAEFYGQVSLIKSVLDALGITRLEKVDYEADDILATLATQACQQGHRVLIASGDRDTFQLINDRVTVLYPGRSMSDLHRMTPQSVLERYRVTPDRYPEIAALTGETADNLPGVPGVGEKTAAAWINKYDGLEGIYAHLSEIGGKRGQDLRAHLADVRRNRELNRLLTDVELEITLDDLVFGTPDKAQVAELFNRLEFGVTIRNSLASVPAFGWGEEATSARPEAWRPATWRQIAVCDDTGDALFPDPAAKMAPRDFSLSTLLNQLDKGRPLSIVFDDQFAQPSDQEITPLLACYQDQIAYFVDLRSLAGSQENRTTIATLLTGEYQVITHDWKRLWHHLVRQGLEPPAKPHADISILAYLLDPSLPVEQVEALAQQFLDREIPNPHAKNKTQRKKALKEDRQAELERDQQYLANKVQAVFDLYEPLVEKLGGGNGMRLWQEIERPVQSILVKMEDAGIAVDRKSLSDLRQELNHSVGQALQQAREAVKRPELNLASPMQLQEVLFDQLQMPKTKKTKRGYTTNAQALAELYQKAQPGSDAHTFLQHLLEHRDYNKLLQTVDGLGKSIVKDGRIHTTFQQHVTTTGRLSSTDPNLQNIPTRTSTGQRIREIFVCGQDYESLMSVDYSQIEMRIMAHLSEDQSLIEAIKSGEDLHRTMAAMVFNLDPAEVSAADRGRVKATSYGLAYGLSAYGLSSQLKIDAAEAQKLMDRYFERFGKVKEYLDQVVRQAEKDGYTETIFGRRRYLPDLHSSNFTLREMAKRAALNAPIQGSAADLMKLAMIAVDQQLEAGSFASRVLLQIHDELILEVARGEADALRDLVTEAMTGVGKDLAVPLTVGIGVGQNWRSAQH